MSLPESQQLLEPSASPAPLPKAEVARTSQPVPDWVQEIREKYSLRIRDYLQQTWDFTVRPRASAAEWVTGRREFLNPVRFLALGFALAVAFRHAGEIHVLGRPNEDATLGALFSKPWASQIVVVVLAMATHPWLRWLGSKAPLRASIAMAFFAFAGPAVLLEVVAWSASSVWHSLAGGVPVWPLVPDAMRTGDDSTLHYSHYPVPLMIVSYASFAWLLATMVGVHQVRWWKATLGLMAGFVSLITAMGLIGFAFAAFKRALL